MRHLYLLSSTLFLAATAAVAQAQWSEISYSSGSGQVDETWLSIVNPYEEPVLASGSHVFVYHQRVWEDWWSSNGDPFPSSPLWRSGFESLNWYNSTTTVSWTAITVPGGFRVKAVQPKSVFVGENSWQYGYQGVTGTWTRQRDWENPGQGFYEVVSG